MKVTMGPPPPKIPNPMPEPVSLCASQNSSDDASMEAREVARAGEAAAVPSMEPLDEAPLEPNPPDPNHDSNATPSGPQHEKLAVPYTIPPWSDPPGHPFTLEVLKDGAIIEQLDVSTKGAYMFGRIDLCDFILEHPTISRFHAVLQFRKDGVAFIYDLGSTHGTFVNKKQVQKKVYKDIHVGDVLRFGHSSRLYILQGPSELMPPEGDLEKIWRAKSHEVMLDREASLLRARNAVSLADGISWGLDDDAVEEAAENDEDEVTWQTFKGQLTEKQEKTRGKILKRLEKVANMKKEIDAIRAKDIAQGGLTQGQQTQIARNEQRMSQIMEELDNLEETLNESIQESIGARTRNIVPGRKKQTIEEENDILSDDDDEFYDRTKKKPSSRKSDEQQSVETADTLIDKKEAIINEMEEMKGLLQKEKDKLVHGNETSMEGGDDLDAYMSGLSSQLVLDRTIKIEKDLSNLQAELDKISYLLRIADPLGEASQKRGVKEASSKSSKPSIPKQAQNEKKDIKRPEMSVLPSTLKAPHSTQAENLPEEVKGVCEKKEDKKIAYTVMKPQWLGDTKGIKPEEEKNDPEASQLDKDEADDFVDYKDRNRDLENAASGLIIRKRKPAEEPEGGESLDKAPKGAVPETTAADAVALLLKHERGIYASDEIEESSGGGDKREKKSKPRRVMGPARPDFLEKGAEYESWVPPQGQSGDGRTSLNDRLGY